MNGILEKANGSIETFLDVDPRECDPKEFGRIYQQANIGLRIRHDALVNSRIEVDQKLRAIGLAFANSEIRERYTKAMLPNLLPELKDKPE